jgi:hypothetical protein
VDEAREELDRLFLSARGREDRLTLAQLYADAGDFYRPQRLMVDAYTEPLARGPAPVHLELWWHAWPAPFGDQVRAAIDGGSDLEPALLYAVMREESGYRPQVVSVSGARGLLQLMPTTAAQIARTAGMPEHSEEDLFLFTASTAAPLRPSAATTRGRRQSPAGWSGPAAKMTSGWSRSRTIRPVAT